MRSRFETILGVHSGSLIDMTACGANHFENNPNYAVNAAVVGKIVSAEICVGGGGGDNSWFSQDIYVIRILALSGVRLAPLYFARVDLGLPIISED